MSFIFNEHANELMEMNVKNAKGRHFVDIFKVGENQDILINKFNKLKNDFEFVKLLSKYESLIKKYEDRNITLTEEKEYLVTRELLKTMVLSHDEYMRLTGFPKWIADRFLFREVKIKKVNDILINADKTKLLAKDFVSNKMDSTSPLNSNRDNKKLLSETIKNYKVTYYNIISFKHYDENFFYVDLGGDKIMSISNIYTYNILYKKALDNGILLDHQRLSGHIQTTEKDDKLKNYFVDIIYRRGSGGINPKTGRKDVGEYYFGACTCKDFLTRGRRRIKQMYSENRDSDAKYMCKHQALLLYNFLTDINVLNDITLNDKYYGLGTIPIKYYRVYEQDKKIKIADKLYSRNVMETFYENNLKIVNGDRNPVFLLKMNISVPKIARAFRKKKMNENKFKPPNF